MNTLELHAVSMQDHWDDLVAVAMLGTDRRNPPDAPEPIADVVDDTVRERPSDRMLAQVAATVAARRAGVMPGPPTRTLVPPSTDERPTIAPAAAERWYHVTTSWPVLEDEWLLAVVVGGWRLPPELVPDVLVRYRNDPVRRARAVVGCGPLANWLVELLPELSGSQGVPGVPGDGGGRPARPDLEETLGELPELPIPSDLVVLLGATGPEISAALATAIENGDLVHAHRSVLINLLARVRPDVLADVERALGAIAPTSPGFALASVLADLAGTRRRMLDELT